MSTDLPPLTFRQLRTTAVHVPMRRALGTSARRMTIAPLVLVDVDTEEGITGRAYVFCYLPAATIGVQSILADAAARIAGDRIAPAEIAATLARHFRLLGVHGMVTMALAGLDGACWDALAIAAGVPLVTLLGGARKPVRAYNSNGMSLKPGFSSTSLGASGVRGSGFEQSLGDEAAELLADGAFSAVKLRLGYDTLEGDVAAARAVRAAVPAATAVMADYNQALSVPVAIQRGRALDAEGLSWIEEPIRHDDYPGNAAVARAVATPISIGENFDGAHAMAAALAEHACDLAMPDFARIGGVSGWMEASAIAHAAEIKMSSHLYPEFSAHLLAATPTCDWLEYVDWASPILRDPIQIRDGCAIIPDRPGVGIEWDDDQVRRFRADS